MENGKVNFHQWARIVMMGLTPEQKELVLRAAESLGASSPDQWPKGKVFKMDVPGNYYVLRVDPIIRVIFQLMEDQTVEIHDVVFRDTLKLFAAMAD